jgi:hypothetical protein
VSARTEVELYLKENSLDFEVNNSTYLVTIPGTKKLQTHCAIIVGTYSLTFTAFVIRKPDESREYVLAWCMEKNASMSGIAFATNELGDIYLVAKLPIDAVNQANIDHIIGAIAQESDSAFNPLLELGFANAIRREWAWRLSRGESLANLEAFAHLI